MSSTVHGLNQAEVKSHRIIIAYQTRSQGIPDFPGYNYPTENDDGGWEGAPYTFELKQVTGTAAGTIFPGTTPASYTTLNGLQYSGSRIDWEQKYYNNLNPGETYELKSTNADGHTKIYKFYTNPVANWGTYPEGRGVIYLYKPDINVLEVSLRNQDIPAGLRTDLTFTDISSANLGSRTVIPQGQHQNHYIDTYNIDDPAHISLYNCIRNSGMNQTPQGDCWPISNTLNAGWPGDKYIRHAVDLSGGPDGGEWGWNIPNGSNPETRVKVLWNQNWGESFKPTPVLGCTDASACNHNALANVDDGSCCYVSGCTDSLANNYNALACCDDGSCTYTQNNTDCNDVMGHMGISPQAFNVSSSGATDGAVNIRMSYNTSAWNTGTGNCTPACTQMDFAKDFRFDIIITEWDISINQPAPGGYFYSDSDVAIKDSFNNSLGTAGTVVSDPIVTNLPEGLFKVIAIVTSDTGEGTHNCECLSTQPNGSAAPWDGAFLGCSSEMLFNIDNSGGPVSGCTDASAINYNPSATIDDGSCIYNIPGCTDPTALNYNALANVDDGSCITPVYGCTNPMSINYNPQANVDDGTCQTPIYGCTDPDSVNYNPSATIDNGSCVTCVYGCTHIASSNYNPLATCDDGSCIGCVYGCTNPDSSNYDALATCDDGTCCVDGCTDPTALNYNVLATCEDNTCEYCVYGCTDPSASNYDGGATCDDGTCLESECSDCFKLLNTLYKEANCEGCNEDDYLIEKNNLQRFTNLRIMRDMAYECGDTSYIETMQAEEFEMCSTLLDEHTNEGVNDYKVYGCTNPNSHNYNPKATHPCEKNGIYNFCCGDTDPFKVSGCTDPLALNYNPEANIDVGSCLY